MPRKPLIIFIDIVCFFRVAIKNYKRFSKYGDSSQAPFQAAWKLFSTSCISSFSPPPISCAENKKHSGLIYPCACGICVPFRFHFVLGFLFVPHRETRHSISPSFQAYTSAPHSLGSFLPFHSASSINSVSQQPKLFSLAFPAVCFIFCGVFAPIVRILLALIRNGFFFQKDSKTKSKPNSKKTNTTRTFWV